MKSRYMTSTTGRMPAMAAPTPRPTMAVSEIGVSRTRSPKRSRSPRVRPNTLPPSPTSMPARKTRSSAASSDSSALRMASMVRKTVRRSAGSGRLVEPWALADDEVEERGRRRLGCGTGPLDGLVQLGLPPMTRARRSRRRRRRPRGAGAGGRPAGRAPAIPPALRASGSAGGHPRSGRASGRWSPRRGQVRAPIRAAGTAPPMADAVATTSLPSTPTKGTP